MAFGKIGGTLEGPVVHTTEKSRLIENQLDGRKYFLPKKCTLKMSEPDEYGNIEFECNEWWWKKKEDFVAND